MGVTPQPYVIDNLSCPSLLAVQIPRERLSGQSVPDRHTCESPSHGGVGLAAVEVEVEAQEHATLPSVLKAWGRQDVQTHWADPGLDIGQIAAVMRGSKRHLHRAFDDEQCTLDRYIWKTRLMRAYQLLQTELGRQQPIGSLAVACGFRSASHFSRLFKSEFGEPPRTVRGSSDCRPAEASTAWIWQPCDPSGLTQGLESGVVPDGSASRPRDIG